jgi:putative copper resistance protein D
VFLAADVTVIGLRALTFVAVFLAVGTWIFAALWERELGAAAAERVRALARAAAVVALIVTVVHYVLTPARMAGAFGSAFDPSLEALLLQSGSGSANIVRVVGLAVLALSLDRATRLNAIAAGAGAALALASFAFGGHTAIHPLRVVLAPLLLVHLAAAAFWFGALWPLYAAAGEGPAARSAALLERFSRLAVRVVPFVLVCGLGMAMVFVRSVAELGTAYGTFLLAKTAGFGVLLALAALNKRRFTPGVRAGDMGAVRGLRRTIVAEWWLIAAILAATAVMTSLYAPEHLEGAFGAGHGAEASH